MGQKLISMAFMGVMATSGGYAFYRSTSGLAAPVASGVEQRVDMRNSSLGTGRKAFFHSMFLNRQREIQSRSSSGGGGGYGK